jgi:adenylate kinase
LRLRVVVVGIPGVGKTTLVEKIQETVSGSRLVNFGTVMLEQGRKMRLIEHRDELRRLPVEKQRKLQKLTALRISQMNEKVLFVDTHLFIRTKEGFWPGLPFEVVRALKPTHLILVEAEEEEITRRRASDNTRYRDAISAHDLKTELSLARSFLAVSSTLTGAPMLIAKNHDGQAAALAADLGRMLTEVAG